MKFRPVPLMLLFFLTGGANASAQPTFKEHPDGCPPSEAELVGTWVHEDAGGRVIYRFSADHRVTATVPGMPDENHAYRLEGKIVALGQSGEFEVGLIDANTLEVVIAGRAARFL